MAFATWSDETRKGKTGGQLLAIATKSNILLYETPKGERAYRFVKVNNGSSFIYIYILTQWCRNFIPPSRPET
jgi:hypothetical protein